ncbi:MAG: hypothetical protein IRY99_19820 [Isosphaeraceae bacterium]|nr:hypothetical protein [Isosphaeraceae bacterium]
MNRRKALWLGLISGGLLPGRLRAQDRSPHDLDPPRPRRSAGAAQRASHDDDLAAELDAEPPVPAADEGLPANLPGEAGHVLRTYDISRYTSLSTNPPVVPSAIVEWIFRRTGSSIWHGDKIAVLCAGRTQLRAYHNPQVLRQVDEMVERFTKALSNWLKVRVRFVTAANPNWRYDMFMRLAPVKGGAQGQQVWSLRSGDAENILARMQIGQGFRLLADREEKVVNGQTYLVETAAVPPLNYTIGPRRDAAVGLGFQPEQAPLEESVALRISPLLDYDATMLDAAIDLRATLVKKLHATKILIPREVGPGEMAIEVPEVCESRFNKTVSEWKLGQTLLISMGILPGILQSKGGFMNLRLPGTVPTSTELLVFLDVEKVSDGLSRRERERLRERE